MEYSLFGKSGRKSYFHSAFFTFHNKASQSSYGMYIRFLIFFAQLFVYCSLILLILKYNKGSSTINILYKA